MTLLDEIERRLGAIAGAMSSDDLLANPWVRLGLSTAAGFALGLAGRQMVNGGMRMALELGTRRILRYAFDAAFEAGHADGLAAAGNDGDARWSGGRAAAHAAERSY